MTDLARRIGIAQSSVSNWARGISQPNHDWIAKIADALGLPVLWVYAGLIGESPDVNLTEEEAYLLNLYRRMTPDKQATARSMVQALVQLHGRDRADKFAEEHTLESRSGQRGGPQTLRVGQDT